MVQSPRLCSFASRKLVSLEVIFDLFEQRLINFNRENKTKPDVCDILLRDTCPDNTFQPIHP